MISAGIDIGSLSSKAVLFNGTKVVSSYCLATGSLPRKAGETVLEKALQMAGLRREDLCCIVGTGYGRKILPFAHKNSTEITCFARGASFLSPGIEMVVDIGGQDSKVILVDTAGKASDFLTNDKCAAGTGRFLETMAHALELQVDEMALLGHNDEPAQVNNTCTVFAESEIVGLLAAEVKRDEIIAGINKAVAERTFYLANRLGVRNKVVFCGGVARNSGVRKALERALKQTVIVPEDPQLVGALGAAILAYERCA